MTLSIISFDYSGLEAGLTFAVILFFVLVFSGTALLGGFIWRRLAPSSRRGSRNVLRIALISSLLLFILTLFVCVHAFVTGSFRGPGDYFSMAFWPSTSGVISFLALRQLRCFKPAPNDLNDAEHVVGGNGG